MTAKSLRPGKGIENHHPLPKENQKKTFGVVYDPRTIPVEAEVHRRITKEIRFQGIAPITTVGEIDIDDIFRGRYPRAKEYKKRR